MILISLLPLICSSPWAKLTILSQLTKLSLSKLLAHCGFVQWVAGYDLDLLAPPDLLLSMGKAALVSIAAGTILSPVLTQHSLGISCCPATTSSTMTMLLTLSMHTALCMPHPHPWSEHIPELP